MKKENGNVVIVKISVILNLIQDLQRLSLTSLNSMRGRCQIKFGMTPLCNDGAFTLIELLVVVLIIGILAAVALPQYQKAVYKSHYTKLKAIVKSIADAEEVYYLANGQYTADLDELDVNLPPYNQVSNKIYYYDWGNCWAVGAARIFCYTNKSNMGYSIYFKYLPEEDSDLAGKQTCNTYAPTNSIQGKICQAESGLTTYSKGDDTNNQYAW